MTAPNGTTDRPRRILVAMSGGVDSSVAAALLLEQGHEVIGCFMRLGSPGETLDEPQLQEGGYDSEGVACDPAKIKIGHHGCCSVGDAADARLVAAQLGIPLYVCNFKKDFGRIIDYFVAEYARGRTPNPCVRCNDWLKFGKLHDYANQLGCEAVASGHYARVDHDHPGGPRMLRGANADKDQSYVLFGVPREQLAGTILPIGGYETKDEVRAVAARFDLPVFDKPDSQEICFVPDNDYAGLVERRLPETVRAGAVLDPDGNEVGEHGGHHRFTIGQRRGVGIALGYPVYVVGKDPEANTVTVGPRDLLAVRSLDACEPNWLIDPPEIGEAVRAFARYRSNGRLAACTVRRLPDDALETDGGGATPSPSGRAGAFTVAFDEPQHGVAPGQAVVLHGIDDPDHVLGGGWIARVRTPAAVAPNVTGANA